MKKFVLIVSLVLLVSSCWGYSFRLPVLFYDSPVDMAVCTLGVEPGATDDYDFMHDLPAMPAIMTFDAQSILEGGFTNLRRDIRSDADSLHIWKIGFFNYTPPNIQAQWNPASVPSDSTRQMFIGYGLMADSIDWVDMSGIDTFTVPAPYYAFIKLVQEADTTTPFEDTIPPVIFDWNPADGDTAVSESTLVEFLATDETSLDTGFFSMHLWIDTLDIIWFCTKSPIAGGVRVTYDPFLPFTSGDTVTAIAQVQDYATPPHVVTDTIKFVVGGGGTTPTDSTYRITAQVNLNPPPMPPMLSGSKVEIVELAISDTTNLTGFVTFDSIPEGNYTVVASRTGYFSDGFVINLVNDTLLTYLLNEDTTGGGGGTGVSGTVTLMGTSDYSGSTVELLSVMDSSVLYDTTNSLGEYLITGITPGFYNLKARHDGYFSDSTFLMLFFADTVVDFELTMGELPEVLVIDWDNGDTPIFGGLGAAEKLHEILQPWITTVDMGITEQDPDIAGLPLDNVDVIFLVTGTRIGTNAVIDDSSLAKLIDFVDNGGYIYWEGPDVGTDYSTGSYLAQEFFDLFGVGVVSEGFSAATGNVEKIVLNPPVHWDAETTDYAFCTEADHYVDELVLTGSSDAIAHSTGSVTPASSNIRAAFNFASPKLMISSVYLAAMDSSNIRDAYIYDIVYEMLNLTDIPEMEKPEDVSLIEVEPNPFNAACNISSPGPIEIFDLSGRIVYESGRNFQRESYIWNGCDLSGKELPSGTYLVITKNANGKIVHGRRLLLIR